MILIEALVKHKKRLVLILVKHSQNFVWVCISTVIIYWFVNRKEIYKFKANNGIVNFSTQFSLGSISIRFGAGDFREVSLKWNVYDFSVHCNDIDKYDILNILKYLMVKNNIK